MTGIPRLREWDAVVLVDLPELEASTLSEFQVAAAVGLPLETDAHGVVPAEALERVRTALDDRLERPWSGRAVRQGARRWSAGAVARRGGSVLLPAGLPAHTIELVRGPSGGREASADGEPLDAALADVFSRPLDELERFGRERFECFVVRADRVADGSWQVTVDPL